MIQRIQLTTAPRPAEAPLKTARAGAAGAPFAQVLDATMRQVGPVRFSAHALERLRQRGIVLSDADRARIEHAVDLAAAKGARESLLLTDRLAFVVSVPNRTVITAAWCREAEDAVFTNIDSVVVMSEQKVPTLSEQPYPGRTPRGEALPPPNDGRGAQEG